MGAAGRRRRDAPQPQWVRSAFNLVERKQNAAEDPEIGSVKDELALLFALGNPWEGAQIGETLDDRSQGETLDVMVERRASGLVAPGSASTMTSGDTRESQRSKAGRQARERSTCHLRS